jgi:protein-tyrosine phosphatase
MIDMHCHFLPGVDDGPENREQSLQLAAHAVQSGIRHSVVTPHIHPGRYENQRSTLMPVLDQFRRALLDENIPLHVSLGSEVRLCPELLLLLDQGEIPMLGRSGDFEIMLLEFPHSHIVPGADKLIQKLLDRGVRPMIAHPERNKAVMHSLDVVSPFADMGCFFQVTAGALVGKFGARALEGAQEMLKRGWVTVLASDAHNMKSRPPELAAGKEAASLIVGTEEANALVNIRPAEIIGLERVGNG